MRGPNTDTKPTRVPAPLRAALTPFAMTASAPAGRAHSLAGAAGGG
jgi:enediyne biosynthesis thioesterase